VKNLPSLIGIFILRNLYKNENGSDEDLMHEVAMLLNM
jgi:hypothetical protein